MAEAGGGDDSSNQCQDAQQGPDLTAKQVPSIERCQATGNRRTLTTASVSVSGKCVLCPRDSSSHKICHRHNDGKGLNVGEDYKMFHCGEDFIVTTNEHCPKRALLTFLEYTYYCGVQLNVKISKNTPRCSKTQLSITDCQLSSCLLYMVPER